MFLPEQYLHKPVFFLTFPTKYQKNCNIKMMEIKEITHPNEQDCQNLQILLATLSESCSFSIESLTQMLQNKNNRLYGLYDQDQLVGCCCLGIYHSLTGKKACLEDVVVRTDYQGKGGGRMLVSHATEEAKKEGVKQMLFTSKPSRVRANHLYQNMNFEKKDTNVYIKKW